MFVPVAFGLFYQLRLRFEMSGVETVFRAIDPTIMEGFRRWRTDRIAWGETVTALVEELLPGHKAVTSWGRSGLSLVGVSWSRRDDGEPPSNWRYVSGGRGVPFIIPVKNTKTGKALTARFEAIPQLDDPPLPGMLAEWWVPGTDHGFRIVYPSIEVYGDDLFLTWRVEIVGEDHMRSSESKIDGTKWQRVKLSEYHAVKEAHEKVEV